MPDDRRSHLTLISGGQSGIDRAALDAALATGTPYGGWCPKGGWAEDMPEPPGVLAFYPGLRETPSAKPEQRTDWNVRDSDGVLLLVGQGGLAVSKGTERAVARAEAAGKPAILIDLDGPEPVCHVRKVLTSFTGKALCIGGPRESEAPGIYAEAKFVLEGALSAWPPGPRRPCRS